jgi:predicted lipid-binding transport protein (Tim44 family)
MTFCEPFYSIIFSLLFPLRFLKCAVMMMRPEVRSFPGAVSVISCRQQQSKQHKQQAAAAASSSSSEHKQQASSSSSKQQQAAAAASSSSSKQQQQQRAAAAASSSSSKQQQHSILWLAWQNSNDVQRKLPVTSFNAIAEDCPH